MEQECCKKTITSERCYSFSDNKRYDVSKRDETPPASCLVLCGPRTCTTLPSNLDGGHPSSEPKRKRIWGLRGLVKMFRRRVRRKGGDTGETHHPPPPTLRTRSASELAVDQANRSSSGPYNQGLSVSHDSVFSPESPQEETTETPSGMALVTRGVNMAELKAALRRRRADDSDDDDPGLPRSPPTSPTTVDVLNHGLKCNSRATRSTCSDASLLSMGSSENDEDSFGVISHHSSKGSLFESRQTFVDHEPAAGEVPLSHKAARHKMAVRPRRTRATTRTRKTPQVLASNLPSTPEVNEESMSKFVSSTYSMTSSYTCESTNKYESSHEKILSRSRSPLHENAGFGDKLDGHFAKFAVGGHSTPLSTVETSTEEVFRKTNSKTTKELHMSSPELIKAVRSSEIFNRNSVIDVTVDNESARSSVDCLGEGNESPALLNMSPSYQKPPIAPQTSRNSFNDVFVCTSHVVEKSSYASQNMKPLTKRSSTDNLTSTPLPGVYIRPYSAHIESTFSDGPKNYDLDTGPLSLDSSIMSMQSDDEPVKKTVSLDKVTKERRESEPGIKNVQQTCVARSQSINSPYVRKMRQNAPPENLQIESPNSPRKSPISSKSVPEFMRIQLNRVQNKDTETSEIYSSQSGSKTSLTDSIGKDDDVVSVKGTSEEIVLRRPSVIDKAVLLDQTVAAKRPSLKSKDEPELMKVFARRSFKLKDSDDEDFQSDGLNDSSSVTSSPDTEKKEPMPTLRSISSKRYSLGNVSVPASRIDTKSSKTGSRESVLEETIGKDSNKGPQVSKEHDSKESGDNVSESDTSPNSTISSSYCRRSFSHFSKTPPSKGLSRTSSANQSDPTFTSAIIKQAKKSEAFGAKSKNNPVQWPPRNFLPDTEVVESDVKLRPKGLLRSSTGIIEKPILEARNTSLGQSFTGNQIKPKEQLEETGAADWKVLIRKRREDRMKQSKSTEADDILLESRPTTARNSKVLEMANNFQKLQVA